MLCAGVFPSEPGGVRSPGAIRTPKAMNSTWTFPFPVNSPATEEPERALGGGQVGTETRWEAGLACSSKNKAGAGRGNERQKAEPGEAAWATRVWRWDPYPGQSPFLPAPSF